VVHPNEEIPMPVVYTANVVSSGDGRAGEVRSDDGKLAETLAPPQAFGGTGDGTNPEQLFAAGYAACFHSALRMAARQDSTTLTDDLVTVSVDLVRGDDGFHLAATILATLPGLDQAKADELVATAHQNCPYSKATRNNIDVTVTTKV
jgi:lipoyl-dependent peroxiredoxin